MYNDFLNFEVKGKIFLFKQEKLWQKLLLWMKIYTKEETSAK